MDEEDPQRLPALHVLTKPTNDAPGKNANNDNTVTASSIFNALKAEDRDHADQTNRILAASPGTVSDDSTSKPQRRRNKPSLSCETCTVRLKYMCFSKKQQQQLAASNKTYGLQIKKTKVPGRTHKSLKLPLLYPYLPYISSSVTGEDRCTQYLRLASSTDHASSDFLLRCFACVKRRSECHYSHLADLIELLIQSLTQATSFI